MYIAGSFEIVIRSKCGRSKEWIDNDPHFWTQPPTWGICRNDLRRKTKPGDTIIFVLPKNGKHPQMIFGYLKIKELLTHLEAYKRNELKSKRMYNKNPSGNIIVDNNGNYNRYDGGVHRQIFEKIKNHYAIGELESKLLSVNKIEKLAPSFMDTLKSITGKDGKRPIDIITCHGIELSKKQVKKIINWINI